MVAIFSEKASGRMKRWAVVLASVALSIAGAGAAHADNTGGGVEASETPMVTVSSSVVAPGAGFTLTADGFCAGQPISFVIAGGGNYYWFGPVTSDASGKAVVVDPSAALPPGTYTVYAKILTGPCAGQRASTILTVLAPCAGLESAQTEQVCVVAAAPGDDADEAQVCLEAAGLQLTIVALPLCPIDATVLDFSLTDNQAATTSAVASSVASATPAAVVAASPPVPAAVLSAGVLSGTAASASASAAAPGDDALPVTGSEPSSTLQIALVLIAAGIGMVVVTGARRRKQAGSTITV
jgi:hypothetical protein